MDEFDPSLDADLEGMEGAEDESFDFDEREAQLELLTELMQHAAKQIGGEMKARHAPPPPPAAPAPAPDEAPVEGEMATEAEPTDEELMALLGG